MVLVGAQNDPCANSNSGISSAQSRPAQNAGAQTSAHRFELRIRDWRLELSEGKERCVELADKKVLFRTTNHPERIVSPIRISGRLPLSKDKSALPTHLCLFTLPIRFSREISAQNIESFNVPWKSKHVAAILAFLPRLMVEATKRLMRGVPGGDQRWSRGQTPTALDWQRRPTVIECVPTRFKFWKSLFVVMAKIYCIDLSVSRGGIKCQSWRQDQEEVQTFWLPFWMGGVIRFRLIKAEKKIGNDNGRPSQPQAKRRTKGLQRRESPTRFAKWLKFDIQKMEMFHAFSYRSNLGITNFITVSV